MRLYLHTIWMLLLLFSVSLAQQPKDQGNIVEKKNAFWDKITESVKKFEAVEEPVKTTFKMDVSGMDLPTSVDQFTQVWHNEPISQGNTNVCWSYCSSSYFESEVYRMYKKEVKLSFMYTVYYEYVERAIYFVKHRGNMSLGEGSEANASIKIWKKYGIVPYEAYTGLKPNQEFQSHEKLFNDIEYYLNMVKENGAWDETTVVNTIKSILNDYMGVPPQYVEVGKKKMTPQEYLQKELKLNLSDYVDFISLKEQPYYEMVEYIVPDNWWHSKDYLNVPLDDFMKIFKNAIQSGYSVCTGGDVSEPGYISEKDVALVPSFDIPSAYIDENARQLRFSNESTTDDHCLHCVGWMEKNGVIWYLIKDSGSGSRNGNNPGYYFYHEDYIKLKMMNAMVHKDIAKEVLKIYEEHQKNKIN